MFLSKLFKRNAEAKEHLKDNRGDENVTKMIWVVIVFVVGALLLTIVSGAFSGKVADWYDGTMDSWFNESNGMYATEGGNAGGAGNGGAQTPVNTITFTYMDTEYSCNEGMTWREFAATQEYWYVGSDEINTGGCAVAAPGTALYVDTTLPDEEQRELLATVTRILPDEVIIDGCEYGYVFYL